MTLNQNGPQVMTTMKDFLILSKIGKNTDCFQHPYSN